MNFTAAFPNGLVLGCATGNTIELTSAQSITDFLPASGKPATLNRSYKNPSKLKNTLAGQVTALAISVAFSDALPSFSADNLGDAVINTGSFAGMTVRDFLAIANAVLGACNTTYSISSINSTASAINESFVDGKVINSKLLNCADSFECPEIEANIIGFNDSKCEDPNSICSQFDISSLNHCTKVNDYYAEYGLNISVIPGAPVSWGDAVIYNTDQDNTEDPDLNLGVGNVIIINENPYNNDGDGMGPDDAATGGCLVFTYDNPVTVNSFIFLDAEEEGGMVHAINASGDTVASAPILAMGDATVQTVTLNADNVSVLSICYPASGAVNLDLSCPQVAMCAGSAIASASNGQEPYTYEWSNGATSEGIDNLCAGTYTVTITDANACTQIDSVVIEEDACTQRRSKTGNFDFSENKDAALEENLSIQNTKMEASFQSNAYPNPFSDNVSLNFIVPTTTKVKAEVVSIEGKQVAMLFEGTASAEETYKFDLNANDLSAGMYLYRVVTESGDIHTTKLLLTK